MVIDQLIEEQRKLNARKIGLIKELNEAITRNANREVKLKEKIRKNRKRAIASIETDIQ